MTADTKEQLRVSGKNHNAIESLYANWFSEKKLDKKMSITYSAIYLEATGEEYCDILKRLAKYLGQDEDTIKKLGVRKYYSADDLKNLNTIAKRFIDHLENHDLRIENDSQIQTIVKQIVNNWISEGNTRKKINFN